ncbi:MAG: hypothetical protein IKH30_00950 [Clostridia bacterium]|nr:hypothetical protein [Clostridia bacterium]
MSGVFMDGLPPISVLPGAQTKSDREKRLGMNTGNGKAATNPARDYSFAPRVPLFFPHIIISDCSRIVNVWAKKTKEKAAALLPVKYKNPGSIG